ncbi:putative fatty acid transporter FAT2 [Auriculariales sp. MPI-PUGE-AT-0066]|nr:putative fatty acid transporter FAT2 [Auriculariales sp. MPI-PUGE-AT-0066]
MSTLLTLLEGAGDASREAVVVAETGASYSYTRLSELVAKFRDTLRDRLGVAKGDVVASSFLNGLEFVVTFVGTGAARAIAAPLNPAYTTSEYDFYLSDTKPVVLLLPATTDVASHPALKAAKQHDVRVVTFQVKGDDFVLNDVLASSKSVKQVTDKSAPTPSDVGLVLHTSGTTGRPKSVPLSHANLLATTRNIVQTYSLTQNDRSYLVMPLFHVHGLLAGLLAPLRSGGAIIIPAKFSAARFWKDFTDYKATWYTAVPTIHTILLSTPLPQPLPKIRFIRSCSSSLAPSTLYKLEETFHAPVLEAYAMTEAAHQMTSNIAGKRVPGTVGVGVGVEISVRDDKGNELSKGKEGEVCVRGENVTAGYWENEKANKESYWAGRWFRTGDQGRIHESGNLQLTGRIKELINRGGEKISPLEIDSALLAIDEVVEAVCFGVEDAKYGEVVWAGVVLKGGSEGGPDVEKRIQTALKGKLSKFKIPERIVFTKAIPKTATGKIQRRHVRDAFVAQVKAAGQPTKAKL